MIGLCSNLRSDGARSANAVACTPSRFLARILSRALFYIHHLVHTRGLARVGSLQLLRFFGPEFRECSVKVNAHWAEAMLRTPILSSSMIMGDQTLPHWRLPEPNCKHCSTFVRCSCTPQITNSVACSAKASRKIAESRKLTERNSRRWSCWEPLAFITSSISIALRCWHMSTPGRILAC